MQWLFFEAAVRGVTVPLTAACAGGLVGIALWFHRPRAASPFTGWKVPVGTGSGRGDGSRRLCDGRVGRHRRRLTVVRAVLALRDGTRRVDRPADRSSGGAVFMNRPSRPAAPSCCACTAAMWFRRWRSARPAAPSPAPHRSDHCANAAESAPNPLGPQDDSSEVGDSGVGRVTRPSADLHRRAVDPTVADAGVGHVAGGIDGVVGDLHRTTRTHRQAGSALRLSTGLRNPDGGPAGVGEPAVHRAGRIASPWPTPARARPTRSAPTRTASPPSSSAATAANCG